MTMARWWIGGAVLAAALTLGLSGGAWQHGYSLPRAAAAAMANLDEEVKTALTHAGFAAKYDTLKEVDAHMHHVLNCLVGPKDKMFDAAAGNPCQGQGNGILADVQSGMGKDQRYNEAWWAAQTADRAIKTNNLQQTKAAAHVITLILTDVQNMK
jgi:hypothetical protein